MPILNFILHKSRTVAVMLLVVASSFSQQWQPGEPIKVIVGKDENQLTIQPFAIVRLGLNYSNNQLFTSDSGTRVGLKFEQKISPTFELFGHIELSLRFMNTGQKFSLSPDNSTEGGSFNNATILPSSNVFGLRQVFIGLDFKKYGQLTFGKQNSAYKIIGDRTDISEANSGFANYVFSPTGSDGGLTGTGRANNCIEYKNTFAKTIQVAISGMFNQESNSSNTSQSSSVDAASASLIVTVYKGFDIAVAYNQVFLSNDYFENEVVYGLKGNPNYLLLGAQFKSKNFKIATNYALQNYGDLTNVQITDLNGTTNKTVVYSGSGLELSSQYTHKKWSYLAGINFKNPKQDEDKIMSSDFQQQLFFYGIQFQRTKSLTFFFEGRLENSKDANANSLSNATMFGLRVNL